MRVRVDGDLCSGQGRCWKFAPAVYELDDEGFNVARGRAIDVREGEEKAATLGMKACPERAITTAAIERANDPAYAAGASSGPTPSISG